MKTKIIFALFALFIMLPLASAATTHCLRQEINRSVAPNLELLGSFATTSPDYNYVMLPSAILKYDNFGTYNFYCDDGVTGATKNYMDLFDSENGLILATNAVNNNGPSGAGSPMCAVSTTQACYVQNGAFVPARGTCSDGLMSLGKGDNDSIEYALGENMFGPHTLQLRLGAISPVNDNKYFSGIISQPKHTVKIFVGTPNLLVFGQQGLKRMNYYEQDGYSEETILFTLSNKSQFVEIIEDYKANCGDTNCSLEMTTVPLPNPTYRSVAGYNWYLGESGQSCTQACASRGGVTTGTIDYVGASKENCSNVSNAFGLGNALDINHAYNTTYDGLGCFLGAQRTLRIANRAPTQDAKYGGDKRFCSCQNAPAQAPPRLLYKGFVLNPGQSMIIPAKVRIDKTRTPYSFFSSLDINFSVMKDASNPLVGANLSKIIYSTHSTQTKVEAGLLDKQDFQVSVLKNPVQKECIGPDGEPGATGEDYAPKINLYFGGNINPANATTAPALVTKNECTQLNASDTSWVYCSQREFLVQLAERISEAYLEMATANSLEVQNNFEGAAVHRASALALLDFDAYIRAQSTSPASINASANMVKNLFLTNIGFEGRMDSNKFKTLATSIIFRKMINGVPLEDTNFSPGKYHVSIDITNLSTVSSASELFDNDGTLSDGVNITTSMEKIEDPKFDWFFYYDKDTDSFPEQISPVNQPTIFTTNVDQRGIVLSFEKGERVNGVFYETVAVPLIAKIIDSDGNGSTPRFIVPGYVGDTFTYWTGFASNAQNRAGVVDGCTNPFNSQALPYRVPDEKMANSGAIASYIINDAAGTRQNGIMYLQTVLYISNQLAPTQIDSEFNLYGLEEDCNGNSINKCNYLAVTTAGIHPDTRADDLNQVFGGIKSGLFCVYEDTSLTNPRWKVFWNQEKVLEKLATKKAAITDATMCAARQILSN